MAAEETYTFDLATPRRPTLEDLGGDGHEDDPEFEPDPVTMPNAKEANQKTNQIRGAAAVIPLAMLRIVITGGTPAVAGIWAPGSNVDVADFTPTDNAAGDTTISWVAGLLPNVSAAEASVIEDVEIDRVRAFLPSATSVRVKTKLGAVGTDANVLVKLY